MGNELKVSFYLKRESRLENKNNSDDISYPIIGKIIIGKSIAQFVNFPFFRHYSERIFVN